MTNRLRSILKATLLLLPIILVIALVACKPISDPNSVCDHTWGEWSDKSAATCELAGTKTRACTKCGEVQEEALSALGHEFITYKNNNDANCQKNATETAKCTRCNATDTREIANSKNASVHASAETEYVNSPLDGKHSKHHACCDAVIEISDHRWDAGVSDPADPDATIYTCEDCGATNKVTASEHEHTFELVKSQSATCEQPGYNLYSCLCGESDVEYTAPANGHDVDSWQLSSETKKSGEECVYVQNWIGTCFVCRQDVERQTEAERHTYRSTITKTPTCLTDGEKTYSCVCGATPETATEVIPADSNAHAWDGGVTSSGVTTYTCQNSGCHAVKTAVIYDLPSYAMDPALLESNEIVLGGVSLKVDQTLLGNIDMYTLVSLTAKPITGADRDALISALPEALRSQISSSTPIMDFGLVQSGTDVDFNGGTVRITMKYDLPEGADADCITVWYIDFDGDLSYYVAHYYEVGEGDEKQGYIWFDAEHFSAYMPGIAPSEEACDVYTHLWEATVVAPSCTSRGYTEYHCQRCGESKIDDVVSALGHSYEITEMIPSTCQTAGSRTMICTREGCDFDQTVTLPLASHTFAYDSEKSTQVTCTQDGISIYSCTTPGCQESKEYERYEAWGHGNYREDSAVLVTDGTKCTDGVIITYRCGNDNYETGARCTHTYEVTVYEHINEYDFADNKDDYDTRAPEKIMLGSYLTAVGITYEEEPYVEITAGCLCGEQGSEIRLYGGMSQSGESMLGTYGDTLYRASDRPYTDTTLWETEFSATGFYWSPEAGPMQPTWTIRFCPKLVKDGCTYTYSVDVYLGWDQSGTYTDTFSIELATYDVHTDVVRTATVDDPTKSCYYNCNVGGDFVYGIHVTETCALCAKVTNQFDTSVSTSSSHYYITEEIYEGPNGFKIYIRTCPCGSTRCDDGRWNTYNENHDGVQSVVSGDYRFTKVTETASGRSLIVYTGTYNGDTFIYAVESLVYYDTEECEDVFYQMLYINCVSAEDYTNCEKTLRCDQGGMYRHQYNSETVELPIDGNPCYVKKVTTSACIGSCGKTNVSERVEAIHTPITTTLTDANGNTTTTSFCEHCGYYEITVTDTYGNVLRSYSESLMARDGQLYYCVLINIYAWIDGELQPTFERAEIYEDATKEVCIEWSETIRQYNLTVEPQKGCFKSVITTVSTSLGHYYVFEDGWRNCCQFGDIESKLPTCTEMGYERRTCTVCGYVEYLFGPEYGQHDLWSTEPEWQERNCLQDGYERRHCANCEYFEELYFDASYGHMWMTESVMNSDGSFTMYTRCDMCGTYAGEYASPISSVDVMKSGADSTSFTVKYINRDKPDSTEIAAACDVVAFISTMDEWGNEMLLLTPEGAPTVVTLDVDVLDDANGTLTILCDDVLSASAGIEYICICLAVRTAEGSVTYVVLG